MHESIKMFKIKLIQAAFTSFQRDLPGCRICISVCFTSNMHYPDFYNHVLIHILKCCIILIQSRRDGIIVEKSIRRIN